MVEAETVDEEEEVERKDEERRGRRGGREFINVRFRFKLMF